jgi:hypothetical protein
VIVGHKSHCVKHILPIPALTFTSFDVGTADDQFDNARGHKANANEPLRLERPDRRHPLLLLQFAANAGNCAEQAAAKQ